MPILMKGPWGKMWKLIHLKNFWLKLILVTGRTSLQSHAKRNERQIGITFGKNGWSIGSSKILAGEKHRLERGFFIELASGQPDEEDIIRYEDDYGRIEEKIVVVSGGFDPIHVGHLRMFQEAKKLGNKLIVILNNDNWLKNKKGFVFMPQKERMELIRHIKWVDDVVLTGHKLNTNDMSVNNELLKIRPSIFANGGDRKLDNIPEADVCKQINCNMVFNVGDGGKIQSSSWLVKNFLKNSVDK